MCLGGGSQVLGVLPVQEGHGMELPAQGMSGESLLVFFSLLKTADLLKVDFLVQ